MKQLTIQIIYKAARRKTGTACGVVDGKVMALEKSRE
jgi:hypothetical protein